MTIADWLTLGFVCYRALVEDSSHPKLDEKEMGAYVVRMRQQKKIKAEAQNKNR